MPNIAIRKIINPRNYEKSNRQEEKSYYKVIQVKKDKQPNETYNLDEFNKGG